MEGIEETVRVQVGTFLASGSRSCTFFGGRGGGGGRLTANRRSLPTEGRGSGEESVPRVEGGRSNRREEGKEQESRVGK